MRPLEVDLWWFRSKSARMERDESHALLATTLAKYAADVTIEREGTGRPRLTGTAPAVDFSVSRSRDVLCIAVAENRNVGVDVEYVEAYPEIDDVAERFFCAAEQRDLGELPPEVRVRGFFATWTRREAYLKGVGTGLQAQPEPIVWALHSIDPSPELVAALATEFPLRSAPRVRRPLNPRAM